MNSYSKLETIRARSASDAVLALMLGLAICLASMLTCTDVGAAQLHSGNNGRAHDHRLGVRIVSADGNQRIVQRAAGKQIDVSSGDRIGLLHTDIRGIRHERYGEDLVIHTSEGAQVTLVGFFGPVAQGMSPPALELAADPGARTATLKIVSPSGESRLVRHRPGVAIAVTAGEQVILVNRDAERASMKREGLDLHIRTAEGDEIVLSGYFAQS